MAYNSDYYKEYYKQHKADILAARGEKYRKDPRYRDAILRRAKVASVVKTMIHQKQKEAIRVIHAGKPEKVFYVKHMELMVNRDRAVLDAWRKSDPSIIPRPLYYDKRKRGVYSESQVNFIAKVLHRLDLGSLSMTYNDLRLLLQSVWAERFSERILTTRIMEVLHGRFRKEGEGRKVRQGKVRQGETRLS